MRKLLAKVVACLLCASASVSTFDSVGAADKRLTYIYQHPQEKD